MRGAAIAVLVALCSPAWAQPSPRPEPQVCEPCRRGDAKLLELQEQGIDLRQMLEAISRIEGFRIESREITPAQRNDVAIWRDSLDPRERRMIEALRDHEASLFDIAASLCNTMDMSCATYISGALACAVGLCGDLAFELPFHDQPTQGCDPYVVKHRTPRSGLGIEIANGWARSRDPVEGRVWSFGLEWRRRFSQHRGLFVRADHARGRDAAEDADGDGADDAATGQLSRTSAAIGLSWIAWDSRDQPRPFFQIDLGAGYLLAGNDEDGPIAMVDATYAFGPLRLGVRAQQGFLDAIDALTVVAHAGFGNGATPEYEYGGGCPGFEHEDRGRPIAIGLDLPILGHGLASDLKWSVPGFGITAALHASKRIDPMIRADLIVFPNGSRDRLLHQSLLAGARFDLSRSPGNATRTGVFITLLGGYTHAVGATPVDLGSGAIVDGAVGWGGQGSDGAAWLAVHGRFGLGPDNTDMRAVFLSAGVELRFSRGRWSDRN